MQTTNGKIIIITAGPTVEPVDQVMQITNMATGRLACIMAETLMAKHGNQISRLYFLSHKLTYKPNIDSDKLILYPITDTDSLLARLTTLLTNPDEHVDAVIHNAAVGDYKGRYAARAEDIALEIAKRITDANSAHLYDTILSVLTRPDCVQDCGTKISSYEPNLMVMLDLTTKVIGHIKTLSPDTMLIGSKLLENVPKQTLFDVASKLRQKNNADAVIANDLAKIRSGVHPAMIIGYDNIQNRDAILAECETKTEIADAVAQLIFPFGGPLMPAK